MESIKVTRSSWTYRLLSLIYGEAKVESQTDTCSVIALFMFVPFRLIDLCLMLIFRVLLPKLALIALIGVALVPVAYVLIRSFGFGWLPSMMLIIDGDSALKTSVVCVAVFEAVVSLFFLAIRMDLELKVINSVDWSKVTSPIFNMYRSHKEKTCVPVEWVDK